MRLLPLTLEATGSCAKAIYSVPVPFIPSLYITSIGLTGIATVGKHEARQYIPSIPVLPSIPPIY